jgi:hypothetical protein
VVAQVDDASLPSDSYGPVQKWYFTQDSEMITGSSGTASPVFHLSRDAWPSLSTATSSTTTTTTTSPTAPNARLWDLSGDWTLRFAVTNAQGQTYDHHYTISQTGSSFSGTGYTPPSGTILHHETVSGTVGTPTANVFTMHISYNDNSYYSDFTGTIDSTGKVSGTWKDNYSPQNIGTFSTIKGEAMLK